MLNILSFDCALKSLGVCLVAVDTLFFKNTLPQMEKKVEKCIELKYIDVINVSDIKKTSRVEQIRKLKKVLQHIDEITPEIDLTLVEYQLPINSSSRGVSEQIVFHYVDKCRVELVGPSIKNKVHVAKHLTYTHFINKYSSRYVANKNHTKENLKYWVKIFNQEKLIEHIPKKNIDDAADAFMQVIGFVKKNNMFSL